ncbi:MAG TPA: hypothetical protein VFY54_11460, partial [Rubrobacter sp.]|nr:hypothetical protein [Rubrobacter sp.]
IREGELVAVEEVDRLKKLRERRMDVLLHQPAPMQRFKDLEGVRVVSEHVEGKQFDLAVRGKLGPLLRVLGEMEVDDLSFAPPDLESVFLHYYEADGPADQVAGPKTEVRRPALNGLLVRARAGGVRRPDHVVLPHGARERADDATTHGGVPEGHDGRFRRRRHGEPLRLRRRQVPERDVVHNRGSP